MDRLTCEAAVCLWEAVMEARILGHLDESPEGRQLAEMIERHGTVAVRHAVIDFAPYISPLWRWANKAKLRDGSTVAEHLIPYDWEFVPTVLWRCVEFGIEGGPYLSLRPYALERLREAASEAAGRGE